MPHIRNEASSKVWTSHNISSHMYSVHTYNLVKLYIFFVCEFFFVLKKCGSNWYNHRTVKVASTCTVRGIPTPVTGLLVFSEKHTQGSEARILM